MSHIDEDEKQYRLEEFLDIIIFKKSPLNPPDWYFHDISESILADNTISPSGRLLFLTSFTNRYIAYWGNFSVPSFWARGERNMSESDLHQVTSLYKARILLFALSHNIRS
jgi:hypothetical protein